MNTDAQSRGLEARQRLKAKMRQLSFLHETSQLLTATLDLDSVLHSLITQVRDYFNVEAVSVGLLDQPSGEVIFRVAVGGAAEDVTGLHLPPGEGIASWVAREGEAILVSDADHDPRFYPAVDEKTGFQTTTVLAVPIKVDQTTIGAIEAINPASGAFGDDAMDLLKEVATHAAVAIRNAELYKRAREAERRYESLFNSSPAPIIVMAPNSRILDLNQQVLEILGASRDELIGSHWCDLLGDDSSRCRAAFHQLRENQQVTVEMTVPSPGGPRILQGRMTAIDYGGRQAVQWIGHDVTEQAELERMRDDLAHMIVHDLRNPLSNIVSGLQMMRRALIEGDESLPMMEVLQVALRSSRKLQRLIDSLLDLRQLEEGKADLDRVSVSAGHLAEEAVDTVKSIAKKKNQRLEIYTNDDTPRILVDPDMMVRVLTNLLDNAVKFTPTGGEICLKLEKKGDELLFVVSDTGPGIPPDSQERVFERFTRLERGKRTKGTGLGLPFCKLAVEAHGGKIWVDSVPGEGSDFKFTLPLEGR